MKERNEEEEKKKTRERGNRLTDAGISTKTDMKTTKKMTDSIFLFIILHKIESNSHFKKKNFNHFSGWDRERLSNLQYILGKNQK